MLTEDYIMRMISQALAVLMTALGLKKAGQYRQAQQALEQALESLLGINARLVDQLDDRTLLEMLTFLGKLDTDRVTVLADIYREQADVYSLLDQPERCLFATQRSLRLYLEAFLASESAPNLELIQKIEPLRLKLFTSPLLVETRLALMDYLEHLLTFDDTYLSSAGLSRPELQAAFVFLDSPDLH
jgi:tetratricopeptide (TPR) repeat protein